MSDLTTLSEGFKGDIVTPSDPDYTESIARWATNAIRRAKFVAFVKDSEDVSLALKFARDNKLPLAIKGGGHSAAGASSSEGGLVIDLSRHVNEVKIDAEKKVAYVGGGAIWGDLDKASIEHGLAGVAGTVNHTGVGGLTLGGGMGWLSGAHGYVVDNVLQATVVTADGSVLTASSTENTDLFWGIRGGGCNFGVVTEFVYRLHPQRRTVYAGAIIFAPNALDKLGPVIEEWWTNPDEKAGMFQTLCRGLNGNPVIIITLFYNGTEAEGKMCFKAFFDIGPIIDTAKEIPYEMVNALGNPHVPHGLPTYMKGVRATKPRLEVAQKVFKTLTELTENYPSFRMSCSFEYIPLTNICNVANDATACIRLPYYNVLSIIRWAENTEENLMFAKDASRQLTDIVIEANVELTKAENTAYANYDPEVAVGNIDNAKDHKASWMSREDYPRLQALKQKYDPEMLFSKWFAITPT